MEEGALEKLMTILGEETGLLEELRGFLAFQQEALVRGNAEEIRQSVEGQIATLGAIQKLESERTTLLQDLEMAENGDSEDMTLSRLIEIAPQHGERLSEVRRAMKEVIKAIGTLNRHNGLLINQSLSYIDKTLRTIAGEDTSSAVYTVEGDLTCPTGRLAVDRKV